MSIGNLGIYGAHGRVKGSFVYMLVCYDDGAIYIKAGRSCFPLRRLDELRNACPISPRYFYTAEVPSREIAKTLERELHSAFKPWHHNGEWYMLAPQDKEQFNAAWREVFQRFAKPSWPMNWTKMAIAPIARAAKIRQMLFRKRRRERGRSYQDFLRQSQN